MATPQQDEVLELDPSFYDEVAGEDTSNHDFDAWWAQRTAALPTTPILGIAVPIPTQVPAELMLDPAKAMELKADDAQEIRRLLVMMVDLSGIDGEDTLHRWFAAGLGSEQLLILFTWYLINGMRPPGKPPVSFARIAALVEDQNQGKAATPNRADRRAAARQTAATSKQKKAVPARRTAGRT